ELLKACIRPLANTPGPIIDPAVVGRVQSIAYKAHERLGYGQTHVEAVSSSQHIGDHDADAVLLKNGDTAAGGLWITEPLPVPQFNEEPDIRRKLTDKGFENIH